MVLGCGGLLSADLPNITDLTSLFSGGLRENLLSGYDEASLTVMPASVFPWY